MLMRRLFIPSRIMDGIRIVRDSLLPDENGDLLFTLPMRFSTKPLEVWIKGGYGLIGSRSRIFRLRNYIKESTSEPCNMVTRHTAKATSLLRMCFGALERFIDVTHNK